MEDILVHYVTSIDDYHHLEAKTRVEILVDQPSSTVKSFLLVTTKQYYPR